jgi:hypothetical protein
MTEPSIVDVLDASTPAPADVTGAPEATASPDVAEALQGLEQKVNGPTPDEVRAETRAYLQEKRAKLRADREEKKQRANYEELLKNATSTKEAYSKELSEWDSAFKDPKQVVEAFKKKGVDPYTLWHELSEGILGEQTPEAQKLREREQLQQETLSKINPEVEAIKQQLLEARRELEESRAFREQYKKEREAYEQQRQQQHVEQSKRELLQYLEDDDDGADLVDSYGADYVYNFAAQLSQAFENEGRDRSFKSIKAAMVHAHKQHVLSLENRRKERAARRQNVPPVSSESKNSTKSVTKTISNRLATEASKPHPDPNEDDEQRAASYRADLKSLFRLG